MAATTLPLAPPAGAGAPAMRTNARAQRKASGTFALGKYREIIVAVAFFLLFDLGVLVLNFYTSFQIAQDALGVNLSGRQRMLSQRTPKALLGLQAARSADAPQDAALDEVRGAVQLFDATLKAFMQGGTVPGGDGKPVVLEAAEGERAQEVLRRAQALWEPYYALLAPVLAGSASDDEVRAAVGYATLNNLALLGLMNELTTALESVASARASRLRAVQTVGIVLALLNFVFILFKFLRRLQTSDAAIEAANEENREILTSVREGLFLITPDFRLGSQLSQSAHTLFERTLRAGEDFFALLQPLLDGKTQHDARDYVELLFASHVKEALVQGINPLAEVEVRGKNRLGQEASRHLSFHFNRVLDGAVVRHLLVTVQDVSERVGLERKLQGERLRSQKEFAMLLKAVDADPALLRQFVARAESQLLEVNDLLRGTAAARGEAAVLKQMDDARRRVHAVKGDAATLGLESIAAQAHQFENELDRLRSGGADLGSALLALPLPLEELLGKIGSLKALSGMQRAGGAFTQRADLPMAQAVNEAVVQLAQRVAADSGKRVEPTVDFGPLPDLDPASADLVREIAVQLVRNAVAHGIESPASRRAGNKPDAGRLQVGLQRQGAQWALRVRDDGAGLSVPRVRERLLALGWYTPTQLESFDERQILAHIFKPGFSTASSVGAHAGRGVGLDLVQSNVQRLGARLLLSSTPGQFTEFTIRF
ncbi:MAG: ATP-binding protein [Rhodoferax sp.]